MKKFLLIILLLMFQQLFSLTPGKLTPPRTNKFYIPVSLLYVDDDFHHISTGARLGLMYGLGYGVSFDLSWSHLFSVTHDHDHHHHHEHYAHDTFIGQMRKDFSFKNNSRTGMFISGGIGAQDGIDIFFPATLGLQFSFKAAAIGFGTTAYFDFYNTNDMALWGAIEFFLDRTYTLKIEYNRFIFDRLSYKNIFLVNFTFKI